MALRRNDLFPGQQVSVDHFVSRVNGRTYESRGNPPPESMYGGGCIFVDHATGHISVQYQVSFSTADTIKAVLKYQREAAEVGINIKAFHTDNGIFSTNSFMAFCLHNSKIFASVVLGHLTKME